MKIEKGAARSFYPKQSTRSLRRVRPRAKVNFVLLGIALAAAAAHVSAQSNAAGGAPAVARPQITQSAQLTQGTQAPVDVNTLERMARSAGIQRCLGAVKRYGPALTGPPTTHSVVMMTHPSAPDASTFSVSIERMVEPGVTKLISATFAPTPRGNCDVAYEMVDVWIKSCEAVARQDLNYQGALNVIGRDIVLLPYAATHHIYMIRTAGGCVTIGKELLFP